MIEPNNKQLSVRRQCDLVGLNRSVYYHKPKARMIERRDEMIALLLKVHEDHPYFGRPRLRVMLLKAGFKVSSYQVKKMMQEENIRALIPFRKLTRSKKEHKKYPYLLKGLKIRRPNQVWATDITYLKLGEGYVYLMAIIDLFSRKILSWGISNTQDTAWCLRVLSEALEDYGKPEIFNTDQGSQYTSNAFTALLASNGIKISMDGVGRALDNVFIERFWKTVKYEDFYIREYTDLKQLKTGIGNYLKFYNQGRIHQSLDYEIPDEIYYSDPATQYGRPRVIIPDFSWMTSSRSMEKISMEKCVEIFRNGISRREHLNAA